MALFDLNRAGDTPVATLKVSEIAPVNWHRYPSAITTAMLTDANQNEAKPRAIPADWVGGAVGDDVDEATATVAVARADGGANEADYAPRTQAAKATQLGTTLAVDITRPRGWIEPDDPYTGNSPAAPVVSSLSPTTAPAASLPLKVTITGTGFTVWSRVFTGGAKTPEASAVFVNATTMTVPIWKASAGTVSVAVEDHDKMSNVDKLFTVT